MALRLATVSHLSDIAIVVIHALGHHPNPQPEARDKIFQRCDAVDIMLGRNQFIQQDLFGFTQPVSELLFTLGDLDHRPFQLRTRNHLLLTRCEVAIVEAFSYIVSLLSEDILSGQERTAYLVAACESISLIEKQVFATHSLGNYGKLGEGSYEMHLVYKTESEKRLILINQKIREMNNIYLRRLGAATEL